MLGDRYPVLIRLRGGLALTYQGMPTNNTRHCEHEPPGQVEIQPWRLTDPALVLTFDLSTFPCSRLLDWGFNLFLDDGAGGAVVRPQPVAQPSKSRHRHHTLSTLALAAGAPEVMTRVLHDADSPGARTWGEKLSIRGCPPIPEPSS